MHTWSKKCGQNYIVDGYHYFEAETEKYEVIHMAIERKTED